MARQGRIHDTSGFYGQGYTSKLLQLTTIEHAFPQIFSGSVEVLSFKILTRTVL